MIWISVTWHKYLLTEIKLLHIYGITIFEEKIIFVAKTNVVRSNLRVPMALNLNARDVLNVIVYAMVNFFLCSYQFTIVMVGHILILHPSKCYIGVRLFRKKTSKQSIIQTFDFLHEVMSTNLLQNQTKFGGGNSIVEVDESAIGRKRKFHRGAFRGSGIKWVFGIIDRNTQKCHIQYVPNCQRPTLYPIIDRFVRLGSIIHSDEFSTYRTLNQEGYTHKSVNQTENYVSPNGTHIENYWTHLKII